MLHRFSGALETDDDFEWMYDDDDDDAMEISSTTSRDEETEEEEWNENDDATDDATVDFGDNNDADEVVEAEIETSTKPYRFFVFDIECSQDEEMSPGRFKHRPMLVCAELICTECIKAGIKIGNNNNDDNRDNMNPQRPVNCVCKGAERMRRSLRNCVVPGSEGRCFRFDNFDDSSKNPIDGMLNFLTKRAPSNAITIALSHNGRFISFLDVNIPHCYSVCEL